MTAPLEKKMYYRVFVQWLTGDKGPGTHRDFNDRDAALLEAKSIAALGYGKEGRDEIQVWKITKERIQ